MTTNSRDAATRPRITAFDFHLWLVSQAESNALEGQHETAAKLRDLADLVASSPRGFEAYVERERG